MKNYKFTYKYYIEMDVEVTAESYSDAYYEASEVAKSTDLRMWDRTIKDGLELISEEDVTDGTEEL